MMRRTLTAKRAGFTLVEVLASLALVAVILPVAMKGISLALSAAHLARERVEAAGLAEAKLNEMIADGTWQDGDQSEEFGTDRLGWRWDLTVEAWSVTSLDQLTLTVTWATRGREHSVAIATLVPTGTT